MPSRRFLLLSAVLVTLNVALWLTPLGLAFRQVSLQSLFGKNLVRAQVLENSGQEWQVDRGVITALAPGLLTLREADGHVQAISTSGSTAVTFNGKSLSVSSLSRGWRVLVTWPMPNGAADVVKVESKSKPGGKSGRSGN